MNALFAPATALMGRLNLIGKFTLLSLCFLSVLAFMTYTTVNTFNEGIHFAVQERSGLEYVNPLKGFLQKVQQHRGLAGGLLNGDVSFKDKLTAKQTEIDAAIAEIDTVDGRLGVTLKSTAKWTETKGKWASLKGKVTTLSGKESYAAHTAFCADIIAMIAHIGDTSNLILDPDLDSFYLMDTIIGKLPNLAETLGQGRAFGMGVVTRQKVVAEEHDRLLVLNGLGGTATSAVEGNMATAFRVNPALKDALETAVKENISSSNQFLAAMDAKIVQTTVPTITPADYYSLSTTAIDTSFVLFSTIEPVLDNLLVGRIGKIQSQRNLALTLVAVMLVVAAYLFVGFYMSTTRSTRGLEKSLKSIASGDLSQTLQASSQDELGNLVGVVGDMNRKLYSTVSIVQENSDSIATSSREVAQASSNLSERTQQQATALEETAASMGALTSTVRQNADSARQASLLATAARQQAEKSGQVMGQAGAAMNEISVASRKIADIIGVIDEIAFQTNLLALNAAVEAARAGEQGRGFAVVAGEVRGLAQRSAQAAKEIKGLIHDTSEKVNTGTALVATSGKNLQEIVLGVKKVSDIIAEIAAASAEQAAGIEQVNTAVVSMEEMTQRNAAMVEQATAAAAGMEDQAKQMATTMRFFKLA